MSKPYIPFLSFLILSLLATVYSFDLETSIAKGSYITVVSSPPFLSWRLFVIIPLFLAAFGYWLLSKRAHHLNPTLFAIHLILTTPTIIFLNFPFIFLEMEVIDLDKLDAAIQSRTKVVPTASILFVATQILFLIYCFIVIKVKQLHKQRSHDNY